ncbi:MAG: ATP synthase F1 subunit gamma [Phycisphaeraceae bacterium]|nr:MAG: ATP synthase F1 subunit gamma [Phycisphaeraceae bacterium]
MGKSREIKNRIKAVKNIQRITRTMQMIATSKFAKAQQAATASKPYTRGLFDLVAQLAGAAGEIEHPLLATHDQSKPELTLVIASDRGLCGPYNANIIRTALHHIKGSEKAKAGPVELAGKKGLTPFKFNGIELAAYHAQFGDKPGYADVEALANRYMEMFGSGEVSAVRIVSMKYFSAGKQTPDVLQLLPFKSEAMALADGPAGPATLYEFTPDAEELLGALLPAAVKAVLFQAFNDAIVSEHVARMVAMKAATDNAGKMGKALKTKFNRARQSQITTELTEIVSGAAALG